MPKESKKLKIVMLKIVLWTFWSEITELPHFLEGT